MSDNEENSADTQIDAKASKKNSHNLPIIIGAVGLCVFTLWMNRNQVAKSTLEASLHTKGVDAKIDFQELQFDHAKFSQMKLSKDGKDTIYATNGQINWHFNNKRQLVIDKLSSQNLYINVGINDAGVDYGALKPFFGGKKSNSKSFIKEIKIDELKLNLATKSGIFTFVGPLNGDGDKEINGNFFVYSPQEIIKTNNVQAPKIDIKTGAINDGPINLSAHLSGDKILFGKTIIPEGINIGETKISLGAKMQMPENSKPPIIEILPSQISSQFFEAKGIKFKSPEFKISRLYAELGKDFKKDIAISASGALGFSSLNIGNNKTGQSNVKFEIARTANGQSRLNFKTFANNFAMGIKSNNIEANGIIDAKIIDLSQFQNAPIQGEISANLKGTKLIDLIKNNPSIVNSSFNPFLQNPNIYSNFTIEGFAQNIILKPKGNLRLDGANGANLIFSLDKSLSPNLVNLGNGLPNIALGGKINASDKSGLKIDGILKSFNFKNNNIDLVFENFSGKNIKIQEQVFDTNLKNAHIFINQNNKLSGDFLGNADLHNKEINGHVNFAGNINSDIINASIKGNFEQINTQGIRAQNLDLNANIKGDTKRVIDINSKIALGKLSNKDLSGSQISLIANGKIGIQSAPIFSGNINTSANDFRVFETYIKKPKLDGNIKFDIAKNNISINSNNCVNIEFEQLISANSSLSDTNGKLCPDKNGRILTNNIDGTIIYAQADIGKSVFKMGNSPDAPIISLNQLKGGFSPNGKNGQKFDGNALDLKLQFKTSPTEWAQIVSKNTNIKLVNTKSGTQIDANIEKFDALNLPINVSGALKGNMTIPSGQKPNAQFEIKDIIVSDKNTSPMFSPFIINGRGQLQDEKINLFGNARIEKHDGDISQIFLEHDLQSGIGNVLFDASSLTFIPAVKGNESIKLEAKDIIPPLKGIFNDTEGVLDTRAGISWAPNQPVKSFARISTDDLGFSPPIGIAQGIKGTIEIADILKLRTDKQQIINIDIFDPGLPIENGVLGFELSGNNSIDINLVKWAFSNGTLSMRPVNIPFGQSPKSLIIDAKDIDIAKLLRLAKIPNLEVEGVMSGTLPINIVDNTFEIVGGHLYGEGDGVLRYTGPALGTEKPKPTGTQKLKEKIFGKPSPSATEIAIEALRELHYKVLQIDVDGRITGDMTFSVLLEGSNPALLQSHPFLFRIKASIPVGEIRAGYESIFQSSDQFIIDQLTKNTPTENKPKP
ncbi:MAG: YdbH domain-containing protein [Caulobacterales bacterium]|nr:YdbH domain-containing protein [Caulobacterales bacterium]MCA0371574.1 YdbH domain-containing protein [Pseudomonadota bacterium]